MLRQLSRLLEVLQLPGGLRACFRRPPSLASHKIALGLSKLAPAMGTVIDGGANVGQFARAVAETYPQAAVFSFEPLPGVAARFRRNLADRSQVQLIESAIGSRDGKTTFYPNAYSQSSSVLPLAPRHQESFGQDRQLQAIEVPITRLDTFFAGKELKHPILLKLDLQGYELEALKGAPNLLGKTDYVLAETVFEPMYEGEPLFPELLDLLRSADFTFRMPLAFTRDTRGSIVQMDALFVRLERPTA